MNGLDESERPARRSPEFWVLAAKALIGSQPLGRRDDLWMQFNERAGIAEYDGGLTRSDAEQLAFHELRDTLEKP